MAELTSTGEVEGTNRKSFSQKAPYYLAILLLLNVFNFAHRQVPAALGRQLEEGLGISHAALGLLLVYATNLTLGLISVGCVGFLGIPFYFFAARRYGTDIARSRQSEV
jgi:ABC-type enterochelin transport system permease subunit